MDGGHSLRQAALVSRVSFEPLSMLDQQNGLTRDGSGVSAQSDSELDAWRVRNVASEWQYPQLARRLPPPLAAACTGRGSLGCRLPRELIIGTIACCVVRPAPAGGAPMRPP